MTAHDPAKPVPSEGERQAREAFRRQMEVDFPLTTAEGRRFRQQAAEATPSPVISASARQAAQEAVRRMRAEQEAKRKIAAEQEAKQKVAASWDEAIAEADTLLLTVPNQLGVGYNAHVIEAILKHVAPGLGWR